MYQLIIFDWDGTLMDSTQKIANCIRAAARDVGLEPPTVAAAKNIIGLGLQECMRVLFPNADEADRTEVIERYKFHFVTGDQTEQNLFKGVESGLQKLDDSGVVLAVATGKSRVGLDRAFDLTNVAHHFAVTKCADETRSKPHPQMLHEILDFTAIDASKAIMVGDTSYDLDMAKYAGMHGLGVSYGAHDESTLYASDARAVHASATQMIDWLLEGRLERAFS